MRTSSKNYPSEHKNKKKARIHHYVKYKNKINKIKRKLYNQSKKNPNEKCCFSFQKMISPLSPTTTTAEGGCFCFNIHVRFRFWHNNNSSL